MKNLDILCLERGWGFDLRVIVESQTDCIPSAVASGDLEMLGIGWDWLEVFQANDILSDKEFEKMATVGFDLGSVE